MALRAEAHAWWDEVEDVRRRERIERRRLAEAQAAQRGMRRRSPRRPVEHIGPRPDRIASWAVAMGALLVVLAILSAHG